MDEKELEAWLKTRPQADAILIAQRAALRVLPFWGAEMEKPRARTNGLRSQTIFRALLTVGVKRVHPSQMLESAIARCAIGALDSMQRAIGISDAESAATASIASAFNAISTSDQSTGATISAACSAARNHAAAIWEQTRQDVAHINHGVDLDVGHLWSVDPPKEFVEAELRMLEQLAHEMGDRNSFWHRWWFAAKRGEWLDWDVQREVALIDEAVWTLGPYEVIKAIAEIEVRHLGGGFESELAKLPPVSDAEKTQVRKAMERNRQALPPTFDAIEGLLILEIERLQSSNGRDEEWKRQMRVYLLLYDAICQLRTNLPAAGAVTLPQAVRSESIVRLYSKKFTELPRAKVDEVVEGFWATGRGVVQAGLIGATTALAVAYGLPVIAGVAIGSMTFAAKSSAELIKAAREAIVPAK